MQADVIGHVLAGNQEAYRAVVMKYQPMLLSYAGFRVPDRDLVDEVVQQTFIRAYEQLAEYRSGDDFGVWLRSICGYMIKAELKRNIRNRQNVRKYSDYLKQRLLETALEHGMGDDSPESHAVLGDCLGGLEGTARQLITYRYTENRSVNEIAGLAGRTVTWVTSTLFRIRRTLRECVERHLAPRTP